MIQRFCFVKLDDTDVPARAQLARELRTDLVAAGAAARVGVPADASAARWDLSIVITTASLVAWHQLERSAPFARVMTALAARAHVIKAWTFEAE